MHVLPSPPTVILPRRGFFCAILHLIIGFSLDFCAELCFNLCTPIPKTPAWRNGRRARLKIEFQKSVGSSPTAGSSKERQFYDCRSFFSMFCVKNELSCYGDVWSVAGAEFVPGFLQQLANLGFCLMWGESLRPGYIAQLLPFNRGKAHGKRHNVIKFLRAE